MSDLPSFETLARRPDAQLDELALAMAAEFRPVEAGAALAALDTLGGELRSMIAEADGTPAAEARACVELLGERHGFAGDRERYDQPDNSMLDRVLARRPGLPILLSVVYVEVARRAGVALFGVGLPGHYVVGHFGAEPPLLLDPFAAASRSTRGRPTRSSGRGRRTRPRCGCSTASSPRSCAAATSAERSARASCGSRCRPRRPSRSRCAPTCARCRRG